MNGNTRGSTAPLADSVVLFSNSQGETARGTLVHITRTQVIFEVYNPYSIVQLSEVLQELRISRRDRTIYQGRAVVSNLVSTGLMLIVSAALVDPWADLAGLETAEGIGEETRRFLADWHRETAITPSFQLAVSTLANFLAELSRWLGGTEIQIAAGQENQPRALQREFAEEVHGRVDETMRELFDRFENEARAIPEETFQVHKNFAQRELHPLTLVSPWMHRCFNKPFGYAGDYVMLNMVLDDHFQGPSTYAQVLNASLLATEPPQAYANRIDMLLERLVDETLRVSSTSDRSLRVLSVGCGPCNEVNRLIREHPGLAQRCDFTLMDFNEQTIDFARERLAETCRDTGTSVTANFINKSIHELLHEARGRRESFSETFDFVYCAGLFDYLSDRVCASLTRLFYRWLEPGGLVIVTNVENSDPIVNVLEYLMEWYLIYRDQTAMLKLCPGMGSQDVAVDETGINMFLQVRKAETA